MGIYEIIRETYNGNPAASDDELAAVVLKSARCGANAMQLLLPLVADEVARVRRACVLRNEKQAFAKSFVHAIGSLPDALATTELSPAFKKLFRDHFRVGGADVSWAEATSDQHRLKAFELRKHAAGAIATAERHEAAAQAIEARGAGCLADLEAEVAAA